MKLRIAEVRHAKGVSQRELADRVDATASMIGKLERGERQMTIGWLQRIGHALGVESGELLDASNAPAIVGNILQNGEIFNDNDYYESASKETDEFPLFYVPNAEASYRCAAVLVESTSIRMPAGTQFIYSLPMQKPDREFSGRLAVIWADYTAKLPGSGQYIGSILPGSRSGLFHILPLNGELIEDVKVGQMALISEIELPTRTDGA